MAYFPHGLETVVNVLVRVSEPACFGAAPAPGKREHNFGIFEINHMMLSSMQFSWIIKQIFKVEPEPGQSDGSGSSQIPRLRLRNPGAYAYAYSSSSYSKNQNTIKVNIILVRVPQK